MVGCQNAGDDFRRFHPVSYLLQGGPVANAAVDIVRAGLAFSPKAAISASGSLRSLVCIAPVRLDFRQRSTEFGFGIRHRGTSGSRPLPRRVRKDGIDLVMYSQETL